MIKSGEDELFQIRCLVFSRDEVWQSLPGIPWAFDDFRSFLHSSPFFEKSLVRTQCSSQQEKYQAHPDQYTCDVGGVIRHAVTAERNTVKMAVTAHRGSHDSRNDVHDNAEWKRQK
jgi:hypothetical protein